MEVLEEMTQYVLEHFKTEEAYMIEIPDYPECRCTVKNTIVFSTRHLHISIG